MRPAEVDSAAGPYAEPTAAPRPVPSWPCAHPYLAPRHARIPRRWLDGSRRRTRLSGAATPSVVALFPPISCASPVRTAPVGGSPAVVHGDDVATDERRWVWGMRLRQTLRQSGGRPTPPTSQPTRWPFHIFRRRRSPSSSIDFPWETFTRTSTQVRHVTTGKVTTTAAPTPLDETEGTGGLYRAAQEWDRICSFCQHLWGSTHSGALFSTQTLISLLDCRPITRWNHTMMLVTTQREHAGRIGAGRDSSRPCCKGHSHAHNNRNLEGNDVASGGTGRDHAVRYETEEPWTWEGLLKVSSGGLRSARQSATHTWPSRRSESCATHRPDGG